MSQTQDAQSLLNEVRTAHKNARRVFNALVRHHGQEIPMVIVNSFMSLFGELYSLESELVRIEFNVSQPPLFNEETPASFDVGVSSGGSNTTIVQPPTEEHN